MPNAKLKQIESIIIEVTPQSPLPPRQPGGTPIQCELTELHTSGKGGLKAGEIVLDGGEGPFCIELKLSGGLDWQQTDPLWIEEGQCPTSNEVASQQIWLDGKVKNKTVTLLNMNVGAPCQLHYRMNFSDGYYCDPIMGNGGGNIISSFR